MLAKLTEIFKEYTNNPNIVLTNNMSIVKDLNLNSLDLVNLVVTIEDTFDIEINDDAIKNFKVVGDVVSYIEQEQ